MSFSSLTFLTAMSLPLKLPRKTAPWAPLPSHCRLRISSKGTSQLSVNEGRKTSYFKITANIHVNLDLPVITRRPWPLLPPVLALVPLQKFLIDFKIFKWKCPLQHENGPALSNMKFQACLIQNIGGKSALYKALRNSEADTNL